MRGAGRDGCTSPAAHPLPSIPAEGTPHARVARNGTRHPQLLTGATAPARARAPVAHAHATPPPPPRTHPFLTVAPTSGSDTYTTSPSWLCAKSVMPHVATLPSTRAYSWSLVKKVAIPRAAGAARRRSVAVERATDVTVRSILPEGGWGRGKEGRGGLAGVVIRGWRRAGDARAGGSPGERGAAGASSVRLQPTLVGALALATDSLAATSLVCLL